MLSPSIWISRGMAYPLAVRARSGAAGGGPQVDVALLRVAVDLLEFAGVEVQAVQRGDVLLELLHAARPEQRRGDSRVPQGPGDRELGERLPAPAGDLVQRANASEV